MAQIDVPTRLANAPRTDSDVAERDFIAASGARHWDDVGENAHDIQAAPGAFIVCDSKGGALLRVNRTTRRAERLWAQPGAFTKGLVVEQGKASAVAWFGVSPAATRSERAHVACDIVGFDLVRNAEIARFPMESQGLVNAIATEASLAAQRNPAEVLA